MEGDRSSLRSLRPSPTWIGVGVLLAVLSWLTLVSWDLSEIDREGNPTGTSSDELWLPIASVLGIVFSVGLFFAVRGRGSVAASLTGSGAATWTVLFAWRAAVARIDGANLWFVSLVLFVVPSAVAATVVVCSIASHRSSKTST